MKNDTAILRELASRVAEIAALPAQEEKRRLWRKLNALEAERPMVMIDQVCWNEMDLGEELHLKCADPECQTIEETLRRTLYQWAHFPVDMVVEPFIRIPKAIHNSGFRIEVHELLAETDPTNSVKGHKYLNQFQTMDDLEKVGIPRIEHDEKETRRRQAFTGEIFDGELEVRMEGMDPYLSLWDPIATWMGVDQALLALIEKPELMHGLVGRITAGYLAMLDQVEAQGLLCGPQSLIHCTGAYTDQLPAPGYNPLKPRTADLWMFGLAQMFSMVSPKMFREFEVDYARRICARFGLVYYGCCDPLDKKMAEVRLIPNVRKISMSPWVNQERGAAEIGSDYVFSRKPSPAFLAYDVFNAAAVREDLLSTRRVCEKYHCPCELILKDVSTVRYDPARLFQWAEIAMQVACG
jgi:hypothetical protein